MLLDDALTKKWWLFLSPLRAVPATRYSIHDMPTPGKVRRECSGCRSRSGCDSDDAGGD